MTEKLEDIAVAMVANGRGLLAADESTATIKKRFDTIGLESTETSRRDYREMLLRAEKAMRKYISGVILYEETLFQHAVDGTQLVDIIRAAGSIPGIKVDAGAKPMTNFPAETITEGLDGLAQRLARYHEAGARFAKWRGVIAIDWMLTIMLLASATGLAACSKKAPEVLPPDPVSTPRPDTTTVPTTPTGPTVGTQGHFAQAVGSSTTIYFDTDRYNVDSQDAAALQAQAQYFARYPQITFTIEGHADERGTREYNMALGERRANSAKDFLVSQGVPADRLLVTSWGKERPVAVGSNEEAWAQNRRAVTVLVR